MLFPKIRLNVYHHTLDFNWRMVRLICAIERFDAYWPAVEKRERALLKTMAASSQGADNLLGRKFDETPELFFWYETDIETPAVVKCAVFCAEYGYQFASVLLRKEGYEWANYIDLQQVFENQPAAHVGFTEQVIFFLDGLRNAQECLMQILDANGTAQILSLKEKQILHIIENNSGIKTSGISKKLGVSISTTKRMLDRLINSSLIAREGIGPGSYYTPL
jgi:hypothetical protein